MQFDISDACCAFYFRNVFENGSHFFQGNFCLIYRVGVGSLSVFTVCCKICPAVAPAIFCCHFFAVIQGSILFQDYCNAFRQFGSFRYVPGFGSLYTGGSGDSIDDIVTFYLRDITFDRFFFYGVGIGCLSIFAVLRKLCPAVCPVIISCYFFTVDAFTVSDQIYLDLFRKLSSGC